MRKMLIGVTILFGLILAYKVFMHFMIAHFIAANKNPKVTVSTMKAVYSDWQPKVESTGTMRAVQGVNVTTDLAGLVQTIYFKPGAVVRQGELLVQLNIDSDLAQQHALEAQADLAQSVLKRDTAQYKIHAISQAVLETDTANLKNTQALVDQQKAIVAKKTIRAPFAGRLGISAVNPGQYVNVGDKVVSLQQLDPLYVDFTVPQAAMVKLSVGLTVNMSADAYPGQTFSGKITTIDPIIDANTRNVTVEATIANPKMMLVPGMFTFVSVNTGQAKKYVTLPQTAVSFNPYGDIVYKVVEKESEKNDENLSAKQTFVTTGETRGDQVMILKGVEAGETVVTSGQLKLKNDSPISVNNKINPTNNPAPQPVDE